MKKSNQDRAQLLGKIEKLEKSNAEQKQIEKSLKMSRNQLKMLNRIIRHDLSNDFTVIRSAVNIFRKTSKLEMLDEIEKRVKKSLATITYFKEYESSINLETDSKLQKIDLLNLLNNVILNFPDIKFNLHGNCKVIADDTLEIVFTYLITNSIIIGNSSQIDITISVDNEHCIIKYIDNGLGFSNKRVNNQHYKEHFEAKAAHSGIRMHIIKKIIEGFGGTTSVTTSGSKNKEIVIKLKTVIKK